ncbi:MAG: hypothetical protein ACLQGP_14470 [Isosphaeraceae bacterium]
MITTRTKIVLLPFLVACAATTGVVIGATRMSTADEPTAPGPVASPSPAPKAEASTTRPDAEAGEAAPRSSSGLVPAGGMVGLMTGVMEGGFGGNAEAAESEAEFRQRLEIAQLGAAVAKWEKNPKNEAILKALEEPVPMPFAKETTLDFVVKYIKKRTSEKSGRTPIPIYIDPLGLQQAERSMNSTVTMELEGVPLKTTLRLLLKQLGLAYCVRDGLLIISSVQGVREELAEAARELLGSGNEEVDMRLMQMMGIGPRGAMGGAGAAGGMGGMGGRGGMGGMGGGMRNPGMGQGGGMMSIAPGSFDHR